MAGSGVGNPNTAPKILLAKPGLVAAGKFNRGGGAEEDGAALRSRLPSVGSLNLLSDSWDFQIDRFLPVSSIKLDFPFQLILLKIWHCAVFDGQH